MRRLLPPSPLAAARHTACPCFQSPGRKKHRTRMPEKDKKKKANVKGGPRNVEKNHAYER